MKISIDVGHGGVDGGACKNGLKEKDVNLKVALYIKELLKKYECEVMLTREKDISLSDGERCNKINEYKPNLNISIHHNADASGQGTGVESFHSLTRNDDDKLATLICNKISSALGIANRGAKTKQYPNKEKNDYYFIIRRIVTIATISLLIEGAFISNIGDAAKLKQDTYLEKEAAAIVESIVETYELKLKSPVASPKNDLTPIMGASVATVEQMVVYMLKYNPNPNLPNCTLEELASLFLVEGNIEGVRGDIAFAQAIKETGFFKYGGIVLPTQNNYAGIGALNNNTQGQCANFESPLVGVRAQIQHLKAYASSNSLFNKCVDPRFNLVTRSSSLYTEHLGAADNPLGKGWAHPGDGYGVAIIKILNEITSIEINKKDIVNEYAYLDKLEQAEIIIDKVAWKSRLNENISIKETLTLLSKLID